MDCRGDARKLYPGLHGMMHKELGWMGEGGVHPQHSSTSHRSCNFQCQPWFKGHLRSVAEAVSATEVTQ